MKVFVSSTRKDLEQYRSAVRDAILKMGYHPIMMEYMGAGKMTPKKESLENVEESDIFIGIYAHRYGYIPFEEKTSITEQEYRKAVDEKKEIFCFIVDPDNDWPEEKKENFTKLQPFLDEIRRERVVDFFSTPDNLAALVTAALSKVKRRPKWQEISEKIDVNSKLRLIDQLIVENSYGRLTDEALKITSKLIASDFKSYSSSTPRKLINYTGQLLEGNYRIDQFIDRANKLIEESVQKQDWKQRALSYVRQEYKQALIYLIIGFMLSVFLYTINIFGVRSKFMAVSTVATVDIIEWLINEKAEKSFVQDALSDSGTVEALVALSFAYELDSDNEEITKFLDRHLDSSRRLTSSRNLTVQQLNDNIKVLEALHRQIQYEQLLLEINSLKTRAEKMVNKESADKIKADLKRNSTDASVSDTTLIKGYQNLLNNYTAYIDTNDIKQKLVNVTNSYNQYKKQLAVQGSDTLTVVEKLSSYRKFVSSHRDSPEKKMISEEIRRLENIIDNYASIEIEKNFVTCRNVREKRPYGIADVFSPGNVYVWAKIKSPRSERVEFKWYSNKKYYNNNPSNIGTGPGYRVYYSRNYNYSKKGVGEVRLYNSQNILIGRKVFRVN